MGGDNKTNSKSTSATKPLLLKETDRPKRNNTWKYQQAIRMLTYLQESTRPDISMTAKVCIDQKLSHERAVKRLGRYLLGNKDRGIIFKPNLTKGVECYMHADFEGSWSKAVANNPGCVLSRTGVALFYAGSLIFWAGRLQTKIFFS